jgi:hypothetical protein
VDQYLFFYRAQPARWISVYFFTARAAPATVEIMFYFCRAAAWQRSVELVKKQRSARCWILIRPPRRASGVAPAPAGRVVQSAVWRSFK